MKTPLVLTAALACLIASTLLLVRLNAEPLEEQARFDRGIIFLPLVMVGDAQYEASSNL
ncbi:MAG: hypothetical protein ABI811_11350 [Acidobacteriota bacterium]